MLKIFEFKFWCSYFPDRLLGHFAMWTIPNQAIFTSLDRNVFATELTLCVQEPWNSQLVLCHIEGIIKVLDVTLWTKFCEVDQVWSVGVNQGIEPETAAPGTWNN